MDDLISRQEAIRAFDGAGFCTHDYVVGTLEDLPSAQPDVSDINVGDMVSRQQAIDAMCDACSDWCDEGVCKKVSAIQKMSSAQPERKKGQWILISDGYTDCVKCDKCGEVLDVEKNFCPNCGADMRGEGDR